MPRTSSWRVVLGLLTLLPAAPSYAETPPKLLDYLASRDKLLFEEALHEQPGFGYPPLMLGAAEELIVAAADLEGQTSELKANQKELARIRQRIAKYADNSSFKTVMEKDKARVRGYEEAIAKCEASIARSEANITALKLKAEAERKAIAEWEQRRADAFKKWQEKAVANANAKAMQKRSSLTWLPIDTPTLDPPHLALNAFGRLPQWPVGMADARFEARNAIASAARKLDAGQDELYAYERDAVEHFGGRVAAKERHNLRIVQVFDDARLLVAFIGGEVPLDWPLFLMDLGSTAKFADGLTVRVADLVIVSGTERYTSKDGAARTVFVVRKVSMSEIPPYVPATGDGLPSDVRPSSERGHSHTVERTGSANLASAPEGRNEDGPSIAALHRKVQDLQRDVRRLTKEAGTAESEVKKLQTLTSRMQRIKSPNIVEESQANNARNALSDAREHAESIGSELTAKQRELDSAKAQLASAAGHSTEERKPNPGSRPQIPKSPL